MKPAPIVSNVRSGALRLDVRTYRDGRFGFDFIDSTGERNKVRLRSVEEAEARARETLGASLGGKLDAMAIDRDEFAEFLRWKSAQARPANSPALVASFLSMKEKKGVSWSHMRGLRATLSCRG